MTVGMETLLNVARSLGVLDCLVVANCLSIAINNTDDHMRNHSFVRERNGWKLAPLFDVNPNADLGAERVTGIGATTAPVTRSTH